MKIEFLLRHSQNESGVECAETDQKTRPLHFSPALDLATAPSLHHRPHFTHHPQRVFHHAEGAGRKCAASERREFGLGPQPRVGHRGAPQHSSLPLSARPPTATGQDRVRAARQVWRRRRSVLSTPEERRQVLLCIAAPFTLGEVALLPFLGKNQD